MSERTHLEIENEAHEEGFHSYEFRELGGVGGFRVLHDRVYDDKVGIWTELSVQRIYYGMDDAEDRHFFTPTRMNLIGNWRTVIKQLDEATEGLFFWESMLTECVRKSIDHHREAGLASVLPDIIPPSTMEGTYLLPPFVAAEGVSVLFATGGAGKSTLAAAMAIAVAGWQPIWGQFPTKQGNVLYLDYESSSDALWRNVFALLKGFDMDRSLVTHTIEHRRLTARVVSVIHAIRRQVLELDAKLVVLDSIGMGRGGDAMGPEDTIALFRALNSLHVPVLALDHVTKEDRRAGKLLTPFGSQYTENSARMMWGMVEVEDESLPSRRVLTMHNTKTNVTMKSPPLGMVMTYHNTDEGLTDAIETEVTEAVLIATKPTALDSILRVMESDKHRFWTLRELDVAMSEKFDAIDKAIRRSEHLFGIKKVGNANAYRLIEVRDQDQKEG